MFLHVLPQERSMSELTLVTAPWSGVSSYIFTWWFFVSFALVSHHVTMTI